ncbi:MAG: SDR family NAD(P)-dependent oxidoreductase, partial [Oligoflexales bacterium]|nr:SDR family NAD(P)-dependent oxidoreductase [Oligoflexales bacterium]
MLDNFIKGVSDFSETGKMNSDENGENRRVENESSGNDLIKAEGVYLITGGLGGLGIIYAEFLAKNYKAKIVLTGRSKPEKEKTDQIRKLESHGSEVLYIQADVSILEDANRIIRKMKVKFGRIDGVIHAAGIIDDSFIIKKNFENLKMVLAPKVFGTVNLFKLLKDEQLDFIVLFSSISGVMGNLGQCDYAFGNSFMDNLSYSVKRNMKCRKILSIDWPLWKEGGMRVDEQTEEYLFSNLGMKPLSTKYGIEAFLRGLKGNETQLLVMEGETGKIREALGIETLKVPVKEKAGFDVQPI